MSDKQPFIPGLEPARDSPISPPRPPGKPKGWTADRIARLENRTLSLELEIILLWAQLERDEDDA